MQYLIVTLILALSAVYVALRVKRYFKSDTSCDCTVCGENCGNRRL